MKPNYDPDAQRQAREVAAAAAIADSATERLAQLDSDTAAIGKTFTRDAVIEAVLRGAMTALECDAGAVVVATGQGTALRLLQEAGPLDAPMRSFENLPQDVRGPYAESIDKGTAIYVESFMHLLARYPAFREVTKLESRGAWMFLPLGIGGSAVGVLAFGFSEPRTFSALDRRFAETVARHCADALNRG